MLATAAVTDAAPFVGIIGSIVMWCGLIIVIAMMGKLIIKGAAMAITEIMLTSDSETAEKIARWWASESAVLICMKHLIRKLGDDPEKIIKEARKK